MENEIVISFYNSFSYEIAQVKTVEQKNKILSDMQETFCEAVRNKPGIRDELSRVYQSLKIQCEGAVI